MNAQPSTVSTITESTPLRIALTLLLAEGIGLVAASGWLVWMSLTQPQASPGAGFAEAAVSLGVAAVLVGAANSMRRGRSGMRGIAVFAQLMLMAAGYYLAQADQWWFAAGAWALGVAVAGLLLTPSARRALDID